MLGLMVSPLKIINIVIYSATISKANIIKVAETSERDSLLLTIFFLHSFKVKLVGCIMCFYFETSRNILPVTVSTNG